MPLLTMIFTDVVASSSTKRDSALGRDDRERDRAYLATVQTRHFELIRECCRSFGGKEVSTMGDAFFLAFEQPEQAIRCAVCIQQKLAAHPIETPKGALRLRIGIHSGFPEFFEESWHGTDVDTAARVEAAAGAQQILISSRTFELVKQMTDASFRSRGQFALKGVAPMGLWEVDWDGKGPRPTNVEPIDTRIRRTKILRAAALAAAVLILAASAVYWYRELREKHLQMPEGMRPTVAVMGFKNMGKPDVDWLSGALAEMLNTEMAGTEGLRIIRPQEIADTKIDLSIAFLPSFDSAMLEKIRRILHSDYVIAGTYVALGNQPADSIRIDVRLQDAASGETIAQFAESGSLKDLSAILRLVGKDLRSRLKTQNPPADSHENQDQALPANPETLRVYSEGLIRLRKYDALGARDLLQRAVSMEPKAALPHSALAQAWKLLGYDEKARREAKTAVELSSDLPVPQRRSLEALYRELNSEWEKAAEIYQALAGVYTDDPDYALDLANAETLAGKGQAALLTLEKLKDRPDMKDDPRVDYAQALAADALSDVHKQKDAAATAVEKAKSQGSRLLAAHALWQLCSALYGLGDLQKGEQACGEAIQSAPFDDEIKARGQTVWATIMEAEGRTSEALEMRKQALETARKIGSQKDILGALQNLGDLLDSQGNVEQGAQYFQEALRIGELIADKSASLKLQNDWADHLYAGGEFTAAEEHYRRALQSAREMGDKGDIAAVLVNLGNLEDQTGRLDDATRDVKEALSLQRELGLQSDQPSALSLLGELYLEKGELEVAQKNYQDSLQLATQQKTPVAIAISRAGLATLKSEQGQAQEAEQLARQAADEFAAEKLVDSEADARNGIARALYEQGRFAEARMEVDRALKLAPRDRVTSISLKITDARLKAQEGKEAEAQKILTASLAEATKMKLAGCMLQIEFYQAELEKRDPRVARASLTSLENKALKSGYQLIANHARARLRELN